MREWRTKRAARRAVLLAVVILLVAGGSPSSADGRVAFIRPDEAGYWQIWSVAADGGDPRQLTSSKRDKREPDHMSSGRWIYRTNNGEVHIFNPADGSEHEILSRHGSVNNPVVSPDGERICFVRFDPRAMDKSELWISGTDGEDARVLTRDGILKYQPDFFPDGESLVYVQAAPDDTHHLWQMNLESGVSKPLTSGAGFNVLPDVAPDGKSVLFSTNRDGNYELYLLDVATRDITRLTENKGLDSDGEISPDGQQIVFVSNRSGSAQVWVMDRSTGNLRQLTQGDQPVRSPVWYDN